jgi:hypothetical protein
MKWRQILIWDLQSPATPNVYTPGQVCRKLHRLLHYVRRSWFCTCAVLHMLTVTLIQATHPTMDITCVAWNPKVEHILASTGSSGTSVVGG